MSSSQAVPAAGCSACQGPIGFDFTMAFQPIVDVRSGSVFAHEALVRGLDGTGAAAVLSRLTADNRHAFDQQCRVKAVELASRLGLADRLSINFMPSAVYNPVNCLQSTLAAARRVGFPIRSIIFEFTEDEPIPHDRLLAILAEYKRQGFMTAIDDFGAGHAGLCLLADFQPDIVKIDMQLIRGIDADKVRQTIVASLVRMAEALGCTIIAEGIETEAEMRTLAAMGVSLMQGYLFARPSVEALPVPAFPRLAANDTF